MTGRRAIVGLCMLCALMISAFAAQSASALGTTAVTCKVPVAGDTIVGTDTYFREHCTAEDKVIGGSFRHVKIEKGELSGTNNTTGTAEPVFLHSVQAGVFEEIEATTVTGTGSFSNKTEKNAKGEEEMVAHGTGFLIYTGLTVVKPAGKGCKIKGTEIKTKELTATTKEQGMGLRFFPASGEVFATFEIEGCSVAALNGLYEVKGSIGSSSIDGATILTDENQTTEQNTLKVRGQKAGLKGHLTLKARTGPTDTFKPLTATTE